MKTTNLNDLFDGIEKEEGNKLDDKIQIEEDEVIKEIDELFLPIKPTYDPNSEYCLNDHGVYSFYNHIKNKYTSEKINKYFARKQLINSEKTNFGNLGMFISRLINNLDETEVTLDIVNNQLYISNLGYLLKDKKLTINNANRLNFGEETISGVIEVNGNVEITPRKLNGCKLIINGSAEYLGANLESGNIYLNGDALSAGTRMNSGKLYIKGRVHRIIGAEMKGGEIHIDGSLPKRIGNYDVTNCKIFQNGKMI